MKAGRSRLAWLLVLGMCACQDARAPEPRLDVVSVLGEEPDSAFARVVGPRPFVFPDDHGPHPEYQTEWWYVTANLEDRSGNRFGVQFTIFRSALAPVVAGIGDSPSRTPAEGLAGTGPTTPPEEQPLTQRSAWSSTQVYMAHVALTDVAADTFYAEERFSRSALGLAGATASPFRVWVEDWEMASAEQTGETIFPIRVRAAMDGSEIELVLDPTKPIALQGDRGFSPKGDGVGDASHYYSHTRLAATGRLTVADGAVDVTGTAWLDREWSTSVLSREQTGWDWFALQLVDGRDVMVFELRSTDGEPVRDGILVEGDGSYRRLAGDEFQVETLGEWVSRRTGGRYPSGWRIAIPRENLDLTVVPLREDQEHVGIFQYWEGAVNLSSGGEPAGVGYVELTGYAGSDTER